jgi:hypothetical protein
MATMTLLTFPTDAQCGLIDSETVIEAFREALIPGTMSAEVTLNTDGSVELDGFNLAPAAWFTVKP